MLCEPNDLLISVLGGGGYGVYSTIRALSECFFFLMLFVNKYIRTFLWPLMQQLPGCHRLLTADFQESDCKQHVSRFECFDMTLIYESLNLLVQYEFLTRFRWCTSFYHFCQQVDQLLLPYGHL